MVSCHKHQLTRALEQLFMMRAGAPRCSPALDRQGGMAASQQERLFTCPRMLPKHATSLEPLWCAGSKGWMARPDTGDWGFVNSVQSAGVGA